VLRRVDQFDVADRVWRLLEQATHAFVALASQTHRPVDRSTFADLIFPIAADLGEIVGPNVGGAAAVGAVNDDDVIGRKIDAFVSARNGWVIPFGDAAEKNTGQRVRRKIQRFIDAGNIVGRNGCSENSGKVKDARAVFRTVGFELIVVHGSIRSAEIHGAFGN